ncbi:MAG: exosortase A [Gammaproteobacteria bacterium]|nr:exosortase A [Gammaproteobacteria bacterium]
MTRLFSTLNKNSLVLVLAPILLIPLIFYNTTIAMVHVWTVNETFTHGFLVLPIVIWLIWQKKSQLLLMKPEPSPRLYVVLLMLLIVWLIGAVVDVEIVQQFCMISIILTSVWAIVGRKIILYILFPLLFLYFSIPFGQVFIAPLMQFTADFTIALIKLVGIPVYRDGLSFILPTGSWSVVEECSGVRYLIASFFLGTIYAYLNYTVTKKRVIFILLSLIVPIIGNGLRAFGIVMIGHYSGMKLAVGADHLLYGWVFFGVIIFMLFYLGSFWRDPEEPLNESVNENNSVLENHKNVSPSSVLLVVLLLMISVSSFSHYITSVKNTEIQPVLLQLPENYSGWYFNADKSFSWKPVRVNPDKVISQGYVMSDDFIQLDIAYYHVQRQGAEAISTSNKITNPYGGDWKLTRSNNFNKSDKNFTESELKFSNEKLLVWSWYRVGNYETSSLYIAKAIEAYNLIVEGRSDASLISIATQFDGTKENTRQKIYNFWKESSDDISNRLEQLHNDQ